MLHQQHIQDAIPSPLVQERGPFSERAAARVVYEAIKTVAACHAQNVIHGDVKPANFLLRQVHKDPLARIESGNLHGSWLKSIDFGCSQVCHSSTKQRHMTYLHCKLWKARHFTLEDCRYNSSGEGSAVSSRKFFD